MFLPNPNESEAIYPHVNHIYNEQGKRETLDTLRASFQKGIWDKALSNEWGRLVQGNCYGVLPTDTISFISRHEVPPDRDITYASFVCDHRLLKTEPWRRVRIRGSGRRLPLFPKLHRVTGSFALRDNFFLNSTISDADKGA